ncbi:TetR/AcrR family transcriptional regulator [Sphingomonas koreensis]|nr:TetR/AcrR family transcriptional regulator [Sphingomonas koreensis]
MNRPSRRTQAERSGEMRARLAEAAYGIIAERGHSAFRMAAVAERAGVSTGAMLHHFRNKDEMTLAAIHHALAAAEATSRERAMRAGNTPGEVLQALADDFLDFFHGDRFWVSLDITMDASKNVEVAEAIGPIVAKDRRPVFKLWAERLTSLGWHAEHAEEAVRSIAALASGYAIRTLWTDDDAAARRTIDRWIRLLLDEAGK